MASKVILYLCVLKSYNYYFFSVVNILSEAECTTYVLVLHVLEIEWFASSLLNCTVHVETIRTISEYDYICITPKQLYFPNCVAKATVFEDSYTNKVMVGINR